MLKSRFEKWPGPVRHFCLEAARLADSQGVPLYLVGGCVRDLFLGAGHVDIDLVVEADAVAFADRCARAFGGRCVAHRRFGTATLEGPGPFKVDIATARRETYDRPGALPRVERGTIRDDLFRRDFTINAMALALNKGSFFELVDFYGGKKDLRQRSVRVMHPQSFIDDPTRIVRAVRFEERLGFRCEPGTARWLREAVAGRALFTVHRHRLRDELVLLFREPRPYGYLKRLYRTAGFGYISPHLCFRVAWRRRFDRAAAAMRWFETRLSPGRCLEAHAVFLGLFFFDLAVGELEAVCRAYAFRRSESRHILSLRREADRVMRALGPRKVMPSVVYQTLEPLSPEVIVGLAALSGGRSLRRPIEDFFLRLRGQRIHISGDDLKALGLRPGPDYRRILDRLLWARLDGRVRTKEEEGAWARRIAEAA